MSVERMDRARAAMRAHGVDALVLSVGPDLPYLTGYEAPPLERLTALVLPAEDDAELFVPRLEAPRVADDGTFALTPWDEAEDPVALVAARLAGCSVVGLGDHMWARAVLELQDALAGVRWRRASEVTAPLRAVKDAEEVAALAEAARAVDAVARALRDAPFAGRTELEVQREIVERLLEVGHRRVDFAIVASGPHGASPHHDPGDRAITHGDVVLCDFGGTMGGYCSDVTRMFVVGEPDAEVRDCYGVLVAAQEAAVCAATVGTPAEDVDAAARAVLDEAGLGDRFIHRTGHGIGTETHEDPYLVAGNREPLVEGNVFSVEPGVYVPGRFGLRLEDIVVATAAGPRRLNDAPRDLAVVG